MRVWAVSIIGTLGARRHRAFKSPSHLTSSAEVLEVVLARLLICLVETPVQKIQGQRTLRTVSAGRRRPTRQSVGLEFAHWL